MYHRFKFFNGALESGMIIILCELIDRDGDELRKTVLQYCAEWNLPGEFMAWLNKCNYFLNSLVDRIVTGFPWGNATTLFAEPGYEDQLNGSFLRRSLEREIIPTRQLAHHEAPFLPLKEIGSRLLK